MLSLYLFEMPAILLMFYYFIFIDFNIFVFVFILSLICEITACPKIDLSPGIAQDYINNPYKPNKPNKPFKPFKPIETFIPIETNYKDFDVYIRESIKLDTFLENKKLKIS